MKGEFLRFAPEPDYCLAVKEGKANGQSKKKIILALVFLPVMVAVKMFKINGNVGKLAAVANKSAKKTNVSTKDVVVKSSVTTTTTTTTTTETTKKETSTEVSGGSSVILPGFAVGQPVRV